MTDVRVHDGAESVATQLSLLLRVQAGSDQAAWEEFVALYEPLLRFWCLVGGLRQPDDLRDVLQTILQTVAASINRFRHDGPDTTLRGWLRTVTKSKVADHYRQLKKQPLACGGSDALRRLQELPAGTDDSGTPYELREKHVLVCHALDRVYARCDAKTRLIFEAVVLEGQSPKDVAETYGVTPARVHTVKSQMLRRLRQSLQDLVDWEQDVLVPGPRGATTEDAR